MHPQRNYRRPILVFFILALTIFLVVSFPRVLGFVEMASRELRYLWWLILIIAVGLWFIFGPGRKSRR